MASGSEYGVNAWPTQVLIDPDGNMVYKRAGEGVFNAMDDRIAALIKAVRRSGQARTAPRCA